jgi:ubiquinone/menaquinone biosynthesis C-methylase UbiE
MEPMTKTFTCPWWLLFTFDNPLRKLLHDPRTILEPYIHAGDTALDVGCGMGYFTLELARLVRPEGSRNAMGRVIAADLQPQMLAGLYQRAVRAGLLESIQILPARPDHIGLDCPLDFALAFWMLHEVRERGKFLQEILDALKPGGRLLIVEPLIHVSSRSFSDTISLAEQLGFTIQARPAIRSSRAVLLNKKGRSA